MPSSSASSTLARPRPPGHLRLVSIPARVEGEVPSQARPNGVAPSTWSADQIRAELEQFSNSPWGRCLDDAARTGLRNVLLSSAVPSGFDGYAGIAFLDRVLDARQIARHDGAAVDALRAAPVAVRSWVRFNRRAAGSADASLTLALLEHIDQLEPAWQAAIDTRHH